MFSDDRIEIIKLFISVICGLAAANWIRGFLADPLSIILVSASAIVIFYYILSYICSFFGNYRIRND